MSGGTEPAVLSAGAASLRGMSGLVDQHRRALETSMTIVGHVTAEQLTLPTPGAGWTLRSLLAHMIGQNYGFAAAAHGEEPRRRRARRSAGR